MTNVQAGTGALNVTPGHAEDRINFRNSPASPSPGIKSRIEGLLQQNGIRHFDLEWHGLGEPFRSEAGNLRVAVVDAITQELKLKPALNTGGGTSDGRFMAPLGTEVVELGLLNASIHQVDEHTLTDDLDALARVYKRILMQVFSGGSYSAKRTSMSRISCSKKSAGRV